MPTAVRSATLVLLDWHDGDRTMRVLFVGNSHTYFNDMPALFAGMCGDLTGQKAEVQMLAYSSRSLRWHCEEHFSLRFALMYGNFDYCVIQQQAHPFPPEEETTLFLERIAAFCRECGTEAVFFSTWREKAKPENAARMRDYYRHAAEKEKAILAPVGELFEELGRSHPEIDLYWQDGEHASPYGSYLTAACLAALLCRPDDLSSLRDEGIDFGVDFEGADGFPSTADRKEEVLAVLDPAKTGAIRKLVEERIL